MDIVRVSIADLEDLVHISWKTFYEAFHHLNKPENMEAYLSNAFNHDRLSTEIKNENSEFYFVREEKDIIGYVKINKRDAQTEFKDDASLEIERIYIEASHQRKNSGTQLLNKVKQIAKGAGVKYIWLGVWEKNPDAIRFYLRNGFEIFSQHEFQMGDEVQFDKLMICKV